MESLTRTHTPHPAFGHGAAQALVHEACAVCGADKPCVPNLFNGTDAHLFDCVSSGRRRIARNATLCRENDKFNMLYVVRFGQFKVLRRDPAGALRVVKFHMQGDLIGLDAIASGRHATGVMALEDSEVCEISFVQLQRAMASAAQLCEQFIKTMSDALREQHERSTLLSLSSLDERFASFLLSLSAKYGRRGYSSRSFRLAMSRSDIGSYLGTTVETVSRLIARFNAQHIVAINGRLVELHDCERLAALLDGDCDAPCCSD